MINETVGLAPRGGARASVLQSSAQRLIGLWRDVARGRFALAVVLGLALIVAVPPALFHGYHYVEGLTVMVAQSAIDDGNWLTSHIYNMRWIERPMLLSWLIAAISLPLGHVYPFLARAPIIIALMAGIVLVWRALRPVVSAEAAVFGAALFLASPVVIRYYVTSVADLPLAVILFGAFLVWWNAYAAERRSIRNWIGVGALLAIAALMKGPQPVAYFMLGLGAFVVVSRTWWQVPGLMLAGVIAAMPVASWYAYVFVPGDQGEWLRYTRLSEGGEVGPRPIANAIDFFLECSPAALLAIGLLVSLRRHQAKPEVRSFMLALSCYAFACTAVILVWPAEVNPRYILPMVLPLCVLGGIAYDALAERWPVFIAASIGIMVGLLGYAVSHSMNDVFLTPGYIHTKLDGAKITQFVRSAPAPLYRTGWHTGLNELAYVPYRVTTIGPEAVAAIPKPAWLVVSTADAAGLIAQGGIHVTTRLNLYDTVLLRLD
jgi:4-amino-4-deoxy-L-arabinose transferase-like glycosyltransferase